MKTDDLISMLATGSVAVPPHVAAHRYARATIVGAIGTLALMLSMLRIRSDLAEAAMQPMFWLKVGFVASVVAVSLFAALRLSRPGAQVKRVPGTLAAPILVMWAIAVYALLQADPSQRLALFLGATWRVCPLLIALISTPAFIALAWAMKGLAPTRPRFAGFTTGLLSGAIATLVYCLHCPEMEAPFFGFWYVFGMAIPAGIGALLGPRLFRW